MAGKNWQAGVNKRVMCVAAAGLACTVVPVRNALAKPMFRPPQAVEQLDPGMIWQILLGGFLVFACLTAIILWAMSAIRHMKRAESRRSVFVNSALNNLGQGVGMTDGQNRVVFCNDRYLELYGLKRSDIRYGMTSAEVLELHRRRGNLIASADEFYENSMSKEGYTQKLSNGRWISVKRRKLPNGGAVSIHDDCTEERNLAEQLATTKQFLESVIDNVPICIAAKNIDDGRYILANRAFETFSRFTRGQIVGKRADEIFTPVSAAAIKAADRAALASPDINVRDELYVERAGERRTLSSNRVIARDHDGQPTFLIALFDDITEQRSLSRELEATKKFLETVVDNIPVGLVVKRVSDGKYMLANRSAEPILNRKREEITGLTAADIFHPREVGIIVGRDEAAIKKGGLSSEEQPISTADGLRLFLTRRVAVLDDAGEPQYLINTHEDVTDRRHAESRLAHMAYHDGLTDLPNRAAFMQALSQMIEACAGTQDQFAVLSVDLDGLKEVNDVYGHAVGDKLLIDVSRRIEIAAQGGVAARLGGDEFGVIIDGPQPQSAGVVAERLRSALSEPFQIDGKSVRTGVTTGISLFPRDGNDAAALLANAGAALFRAKARSRGSIGVFEPQMDQQIRDRRVLHQDLSIAIHNGELSLHYQPQAKTAPALADAEITGFEALARWIHPVRGFVPPGEFIPLAEESGLIVEMGEWILRQACHEAATWAQPLQVAVNLSPAQFMHGDLVSLVHSILLETGLDPGRLELEITEGVLIDDFDRGLALLRRLKALGVRVSMDDFGSGYSSLTYLQAFPFDKIKIDRAFVMNLGRNPQSAAIIRAVIGLGHGLDVSIVAEGVETAAQLAFLAEEGCDGVQGYYLGRPAPIAQYAVLVGCDAAVAPAPAVRMAG